MSKIDKAPILSWSCPPAFINILSTIFSGSLWNFLLPAGVLRLSSVIGSIDSTLPFSLISRFIYLFGTALFFIFNHCLKFPIASSDKDTSNSFSISLINPLVLGSSPLSTYLVKIFSTLAAISKVCILFVKFSGVSTILDIWAFTNCSAFLPTSTSIFIPTPDSFKSSGTKLPFLSSVISEGTSYIFSNSPTNIASSFLAIFKSFSKFIISALSFFDKGFDFFNLPVISPIASSYAFASSLTFSSLDSFSIILGLIVTLGVDIFSSDSAFFNVFSLTFSPNVFAITVSIAATPSLDRLLVPTVAGFLLNLGASDITLNWFNL